MGKMDKEGKEIKRNRKEGEEWKRREMFERYDKESDEKRYKRNFTRRG